MDTEVQRVADCSYLACLYDLWGRINLHEYAERDGRWYLDVSILEIDRFRIPLPFTFIRQEFGGRLGKVIKDGQELVIWRAIGPRAYDVLRSIRPYVLSNPTIIDEALDTFVLDEEYEEE